jgi:hypothetical protein
MRKANNGFNGYIFLAFYHKYCPTLFRRKLEVMVVSKINIFYSAPAVSSGTAETNSNNMKISKSYVKIF